MMELNTLVDRAVEIRNAIVSPNLKQRLADAAQELSMAGNNQARVELLNEASLALTRVLYETEADGAWANIDRRTHRLLIPAPWGRSGWRKWGLRQWEATILRNILQVRCQMRRTEPLFDYSEEGRSWHLNLRVYGRLDQALMYWKANPVTLKDWRMFADIYRQQAHERALRGRHNA